MDREKHIRLLWAALCLGLLVSCIPFSFSPLMRSQRPMCPVFHEKYGIDSQATLLVVKDGYLAYLDLAMGKISPVKNVEGRAADIVLSPNHRYVAIPLKREPSLSELSDDVAFVVKKLETAPGVYAITSYLEGIEIFDIQEKTVKRIAIPEHLRLYRWQGWLTDHDLLFEPILAIIYQGFLSFPIVDKNLPSGSIFLYNPFTGQVAQLSPNLSRDMLTDLLVTPPYWPYPFSYNVDASQVLFFKHPFDPDDSPDLVLWSVSEEKVIWQKNQNPGQLYGPGIWAPDGKKVAYLELKADDPYRAKITIIEQNGGQIDVPLSQGEFVPVQMPLPFEWSSRGRYLAFWIAGGKENDNSTYQFQLAIYDIRNHEVINTCLKMEHGGKFFWSLDEKRVLVGNLGQYLLLDLQDMEYVRFNLEDALNVIDVIGWVK